MGKVIAELESKSFHVEATIRKRRLWPKLGTGDLIGTHFEDKEVGDFRIVDARTQENMSFRIFFMKDPDCVMEIIASWITLGDSEDTKTRI